jgi:hypothetical protein
MKSNAPTENRTRGPTMATLDFTTKPLVLFADSFRMMMSSSLAYMFVVPKEIRNLLGPRAACFGMFYAFLIIALPKPYIKLSKR